MGTSYDKLWFPALFDKTDHWEGFVVNYIKGEWSNGHNWMDVVLTLAERAVRKRHDRGDACEHVDEQGQYTVGNGNLCVICYQNEIIKLTRQGIEWSNAYTRPLLEGRHENEPAKNAAIKELRAEVFTLKEVIRDKDAQIAELAQRVNIARNTEQLTKSEINFYKQTAGPEKFATMKVKYDAVCVTLKAFLEVNKNLVKRRNEVEARLRSLMARHDELEKAYANTVTNASAGPLINVMNNLCIGMENLNMQVSTLVSKATGLGETDRVYVQTMDRGCVVERYMCDPLEKERLKIVRTEQFYQGGPGSDTHLIVHGAFDTPPLPEDENGEGWVNYVKEIIPSEDSLGGVKDLIRRSSQRDIRGTGNVAANAKRRLQEQRQRERRRQSEISREELDSALHGIANEHTEDLMRLANYNLPGSSQPKGAPEGASEVNTTPLGAKPKRFTAAARRAACLPPNLSYYPSRDSYTIDPGVFRRMDATGEAALASVTRALKKRKHPDFQPPEPAEYALVNEYLDQTNSRVNPQMRLVPPPEPPKRPTPELDPENWPERPRQPPPAARASSDAESELYEARGDALDVIVMDVPEEGEDGADAQ